MNLSYIFEKLTNIFQPLLFGTLSLLGVAFATFIGAWAAFKLERYYRRVEVRKEQFEKARRVQLTLFENWGILNEIKSKLDDIRDDELRSIKLGFIEVQHHGLDIDIDSVLFLMDENQIDLLHKLVQARSRFNIVLSTIKEHRRIYNQLYPSSGVELMKIKESPDKYIKDAESKRFSTKMNQLQLIVNTLYDAVPVAEEATKEALLRFESFLRDKFSDRSTFLALLEPLKDRQNDTTT